ncbi:MAG: hypothetical protein KJT03_14325, partial [Verrucomicrobiae bacterium]|nr:hypothetical protein [Verrucomicrobiae bacterium]
GNFYFHPLAFCIPPTLQRGGSSEEITKPAAEEAVTAKIKKTVAESRKTKPDSGNAIPKDLRTSL